MRWIDLLWWIFFGVGAAAWITVLVGLYSGWSLPTEVLAGLAIYGLVLALIYHGLGIRRFWGQRTP